MASDDTREKRRERLVVNNDSTSSGEPESTDNRSLELPPREQAPADALLVEDGPQRQGIAWGKLAFALLLAGGLLWFAFKDADMNKILAYASNVNMGWVVATYCIGVIAHLMRAYRWTIMLEPVAGRKISTWNSFYATMLGYAVNLVIPRGGEVARLVLINKIERIPVAGVAPTMLIDRLIDVVMLALLLGASLTFLPQKILTEMPYLIPAGVAMLIGAVLGMALLPKAAEIIKAITAMSFVKNNVPERILTKLHSVADQFEVGSKCLANPKALPMITALSLGMWVIYALNFYFMILAFDLQKVVSLKDCFLTFAVGSIGVMVPTPGSAGSMHVIVTQVLTSLTELPYDQALAYVTVLHLVTFVVVNSLTAGACVVLNNFIKPKGAKSA